MSRKRRAVESLEQLAAADSPSSKRARVEDDVDETSASNGVPSNGHLMSPRDGDDTGTPDILGADRAEHEEMMEAGAASPNDEDFEDDDNHPAASIRQQAPTEGYDDFY